jgi:folate-binding protein YgfZ
MEASPLLDHHRSRGRRLVPRPEAPTCPTPLYFAPPPEEYRAARAGAALFDESDRARLAVGGKDAADFLHRLLANHVKALAVDAADRNALLTPKGKVQFLFECVRRLDGFELELPPLGARPLHEALERYHFAEALTLADTSAGFAPLELAGPTAAATLSRAFALAAPAPGAPEVRVAWRGFTLGVRALAADHWRIAPAPAELIAAWEALVAAGATPTGLVVRDSLRVERARGLFAVDVDEQVYPAEAGLTEAFALDKGCYVGQEVVAKIDTYGGINKRLCVLAVDHSDPVARGTKLVRVEEGERRELGLVTSWAYSFALDTGLVLAYVKRQHQEPGTEFELDQGPARARLVTPPG